MSKIHVIQIRERDEKIEKQQQEITELKAMVNTLINAVNTMERANICDRMQITIDINNKYPQQCLASVKADAVNEFINSYINVKAMDGHGDEAEEVSNYASAYNKLREQK